ncbi:MAG: DDE-type integrase/transposase/recombinase [Gammaproteobacteria bacterium]|nr:DDE-type integrase/transposase/recombinase [Gammaproteobacteria bacterium]
MILDLYSRQAVGWAMDKTMTAPWVCKALQMARWRRTMSTGVIMPTDRRRQYGSKQHQRMLRKHRFISSMSAKGNCFDNACAEAFCHALKVETIYGNRDPTRHAVRQEVFQYIETFYHTTRLHATLSCVSPTAFEAAAVA